jgi:enoyl-CoA hydratase
MELVLTGSPTTATELSRLGLLNKVCSSEEDVLDESIKLGEAIAANSAPAIGLAKQAVKAGKHPWYPPCPENFVLSAEAEATTLNAGLEIERALYYSSFSLADCQEGVAAFLEKRAPNFQHQ